MALSGISRCK